MNVIQLHDKVLGLLDQARSGRIHPSMVDSAINVAYDTLFKQKIGAENIVGPNGFYPGESGRIKDSLGFYYESVTLPCVSQKINVPTLLSEYCKHPSQLLLTVELNIGASGVDSWITPTPINGKDRSEYKDNTFLSPSKSLWKTSYVIYDGKYLEFLISSATCIKEIRLGYIRIPSLISHGILVNTVDYTDHDKSIIVYSPVINYFAEKKFRGQELIVIDHTNITNGFIVKDYSIVDIDPLFIEQIVMSATKIISMSKMGILNDTKEN